MIYNSERRQMTYPEGALVLCQDPEGEDHQRYMRTVRTSEVLEEVQQERIVQHAKFGQPDWPDGLLSWSRAAHRARNRCQEAFALGRGTWRHILEEEFCEALCAESDENLRDELIQVAAVAVAWVESIDRRESE